MTAVMLAIVTTSPAAAGLYADDLSRCLVKSTTETDRLDLMRWMFSAYAAGAIGKSMATVTQVQHDHFNKTAASLFERLILTDCRKEAVAAIRNEGGGTIESSFQTLGIVAGRGLLSDPGVSAELQALGKYFDKDRFKVLSKEAGVTEPGSPTK